MAFNLSKPVLLVTKLENYLLPFELITWLQRMGHFDWHQPLVCATPIQLAARNSPSRTQLKCSLLKTVMATTLISLTMSEALKKVMVIVIFLSFLMARYVLPLLDTHFGLMHIHFRWRILFPWRLSLSAASTSIPPGRQRRQLHASEPFQRWSCPLLWLVHSLSTLLLLPKGPTPLSKLFRMTTRMWLLPISPHCHSLLAKRFVPIFLIAILHWLIIQHNLIYLFFEQVDSDPAYTGPALPSNRHFKCWHGACKVLTVLASMKYNVQGTFPQYPVCMILNHCSALIRLLKSDIPQMYHLYELLNDWGMPPSVNELAMAKGKAVFDITAMDAHLVQLERESNTLLKAFTKQALKRNVCIFLTIIWSIFEMVSGRLQTNHLKHSWQTGWLLLISLSTQWRVLSFVSSFNTCTRRKPISIFLVGIPCAIRSWRWVTPRLWSWSRCSQWVITVSPMLIASHKHAHLSNTQERSLSLLMPGHSRIKLHFLQLWSTM